MSPVKVNVGGTWKDAASVHTRVGGVWKTAADMPVRVGGVWKTGNLITGAFESIASTSVTGASFVDFTSIPQTYSYLQLRFYGLSGVSNASTDLFLHFNGNQSNYAYNYVRTTTAPSFSASSQINQGNIFIGRLQQGNSTNYTSIIADIYGYSNTGMGTTVKYIGGSNGQLDAGGGFWSTTSAVTSMRLSMFQTITGVVSLYGIKVA